MGVNKCVVSDGVLLIHYTPREAGRFFVGRAAPVHKKLWCSG